ncbi:NHS-like protein 3 isoform X2 [Oncorhynchus clarkii lewisi]|uniref:NHS-like protein 3 isoform X2 n=2 Tax=Oncorhynchus clarkii lewisi TaxID=490388 RepID=UPI0039B9BD8F
MVARMISQVLLTGTLCCLLPGLLDATPLKARAVREVSIDSAQARGFLSQSRPKRNVDHKWHRGTPDFQSYYKFYNSIGHIEGLYEIDRIRMLYQQMRHLEQVYGPDASSYQNALGVITPPPTTIAPTTTTLPDTTQPTPTTQAPLSFTKTDVLYLCNPKDPLCKAHIVYLPAGAIPVLCDPRYNPACKPQTGKVVIAAVPMEPAPAAPLEPAPAAPLEPAVEAPPPRSPKKSLQPPRPPPIVIKGMEYDCDPYWDPDCLIDHPPRPVKATEPLPPPHTLPVVVEKEVKEDVALEETKTPFDLRDFRHDIFDPYRYSDQAPDPQ